MKSKSPTTINDVLPNVHPGEVLRHDFLEPLGIASTLEGIRPYALADAAFTPV